MSLTVFIFSHVLDTTSMSWFKQQDTMLVGIDVTHPGPGSVKGTPSIAAVVASADKDCSQYPASLEIQESKKEVSICSSGCGFNAQRQCLHRWLPILIL